MTGSAVPRRMLGRELKKLREQSGVSAVVAAEAIEVSPQTLWRMESGQQGPKLKELYIKVLCEIYSAPADLTEALVGLIAETKKPGWWHSNFADLIPAHFDLFIGFEEIATRMTSFQMTLVPGLLQTPAYRRAVAWMEFLNHPSSSLEPMLELHRHRVARLEDEVDVFEFRVLLSESVLHHQVGGAGVMQEQLEHLVNVGWAPKISIQVVPYRVGSHLGLLTGSFVLMEFPSHVTSRLAEPPVVYVQGYTGALYLDQESEIDQYRQAVKQIERVALDERKSRDLLMKAAREYLP
ncbi:helix-turn-helix domain-containing protein [Nocardia jiangxiensis]|uniref:Helix-turn-helix domain-containing protein n=1 Tax=Nocardia jiangxiensis TaxID=282685 RepID=A0ABW6S892_9NOCA